MGRHPMGEGVDPNPRIVAEKLVDPSALVMGSTARDLHDRFPSITKARSDAYAMGSQDKLAKAYAASLSCRPHGIGVAAVLGDRREAVVQVLGRRAHHEGRRVDQLLGHDPRVGVDTLTHGVAPHVLHATGDGDVDGAERDELAVVVTAVMAPAHIRSTE